MAISRKITPFIANSVSKGIATENPHIHLSGNNAFQKTLHVIFCPSYQMHPLNKRIADDADGRRCAYRGLIANTPTHISLRATPHCDVGEPFRILCPTRALGLQNLMPHRGPSPFESYAPSGLWAFRILCPIGACRR